MYPICLLKQGFIPKSSVIVNAPDCQALITANGMGFIQYPVSLVLSFNCRALIANLTCPM